MTQPAKQAALAALNNLHQADDNPYSCEQYDIIRRYITAEQATAGDKDYEYERRAQMDEHWAKSTAQMCRELHHKLGRDAMLRQNDPVQTLYDFAVKMFDEGYQEGISDAAEKSPTPSATVGNAETILAELHEIVPATPLGEGMVRDIVADVKRMIARQERSATVGGVRELIADAKNAVMELANTRMEMTLEEWSNISGRILRALATPPAAHDVPAL